MTAMPEPPQNVVVLMHDGRSIPVDCVYRGKDSDGLHVWVTVGLLPGQPRAVSIDLLPPMTTITMGIGDA